MLHTCDAKVIHPSNIVILYICVYAPTMGGSSTTGKSGGGKLADGWIGTTQGTKAVASKRAGIIWKRTMGDLYCTHSHQQNKISHRKTK